MFGHIRGNTKNINKVAVGLTAYVALLFIFASCVFAPAPVYAGQKYTAETLPSNIHPTAVQLKQWGFSSESELRDYQYDISDHSDRIKEGQKQLDAAIANGEAGYYVVGDKLPPHTYWSEEEAIRGEEEYRRQREEELRQSAERLQNIRAYISSPIIPFDAKQYAGLVVGKEDKKEDGNEDTATSDNPWKRFLTPQKSTDIYAVINSGTVIGAMLISGVNSDLPGNILAQVSENVFDSVTGKRLLIPQGCRLFGQYDSKVLFGQKRPLIKWTRLIYPDGSTLNLENMPGTDRRGYAGFKAKVNNHFWPMVSSAALVSVFAAVATYYDQSQVVINSPTINLGATNLPVGSIICWSVKDNIPDNWLLVDGQEFNATVYPQLYEVRGTTKLPAYDNSDPEKQWIIKAADDTSTIRALIGAGNSYPAYYDARSTVGRELGRTLQNMATKLLEKYIEMAPTLIVKPGYKFSVIVNKEILLPVKTLSEYSNYVSM